MPLTALAAIVAGLVVLLVPRALHYAVAIYLLLIGVLGLLQVMQGGPVRPQPVLAVVAGVLVLAKPDILRWVVGGYLILIGLLESGALRI
jgi:hypothetical protein